MTRVKRGMNSVKRRKNILARAKGYRIQRSKKVRAANDALKHAGAYAFAHRRDKKNDFRKLWNVKINASLREMGTTYSKFIHALKLKNVEVDRKILATFAEFHPEIFKQVVSFVK
jgi:large subunit ribosomal protein L20